MNTTANPALQPIPPALVEQLSGQHLAVWQYLLQPK